MTTNAIPSTNVNGTFNTTTSNNFGVIAQPIQKHKMLANPQPIPTGVDARLCVTFEARAKALKKRIEWHLDILYNQMQPGLVGAITSRCILSGSSISSMYHAEEVKDYDLWMVDFGSNNTELLYMDTLIKNSYADHIAEYSEEYSGMKKTHKVITQNAITLKNKMQFITLSEYKDARITFDFIHCMPYYDLSSEKFFISEQQMDVIANKKLMRNPKGKTPVQWRIEKFQKRGWTF
jgi:hypothetical protein